MKLNEDEVRGWKIRRLRRSLGLSPEEVGKATGYATKIITAVEYGDEFYSICADDIEAKLKKLNKSGKEDKMQEKKTRAKRAENNSAAGEAVRARRTALNLTVKELADMAECSESNLKGIENGRYMVGRNYKTILQILDDLEEKSEKERVSKTDPVCAEAPEDTGKPEAVSPETIGPESEHTKVPAPVEAALREGLKAAIKKDMHSGVKPGGIDPEKMKKYRELVREKLANLITEFTPVGGIHEARRKLEDIDYWMAELKEMEA